MEQKHIYQVAGYRFELEGKIPALSNLEPFLTTKTDAPLLFSLKLVNSLPLIPTTSFYTTDDGPGFPVIAIDRYSTGGWRFRVRPLPGLPVAGEMSASEDFSSAQLLLTGADDAFAVNNSLMLLFAFSSARSGLLEMHASVVMNEGKGYLFLGKSGTGKSTHRYSRHRTVQRRQPHPAPEARRQRPRGRQPLERENALLQGQGRPGGRRSAHPAGAVQQDPARARAGGLCFAHGVGVGLPPFRGTGRWLAPHPGRPHPHGSLLRPGLPAQRRSGRPVP